jgi:hypothetical protein
MICMLLVLVLVLRITKKTSLKMLPNVLVVVDEKIEGIEVGDEHHLESGSESGSGSGFGFG